MMVLVFSSVILCFGPLLVVGEDLSELTGLPWSPLLSFTQNCLDKQELSMTFVTAIEKFSECLATFCDAGVGDSYCGTKQNLTSRCGRFTSKDYDIAEEYPANSNCSWFIQSEGTNVNISFEHIDLEYSGSNCSYDYILVLEGLWLGVQDITTIPKDNVITKMCGRMHPENVYSRTFSGVTVLFNSDRSMQGKGFEATYEFLDTENFEYRFQPIAVTAHSGVLETSPLTWGVMEHGYYMHKWRVRVEAGKSLKLNWQVLEHGTPGETPAFVRIHDGPSEHAVKLFEDYGSPDEPISSGSINASSFQIFIVVGQPTNSTFSMRLSYSSHHPSKCMNESKGNCPDGTYEELVVGSDKIVYSDGGDTQLHKNFIAHVDDGHEYLNIKLTRVDFGGSDIDDCAYGGVVVYDGVLPNNDKIFIGPSPICGNWKENQALINQPFQPSHDSVFIAVYVEDIPNSNISWAVNIEITATKIKNPLFGVHSENYNPIQNTLDSLGVRYTKVVNDQNMEGVITFQIDAEAVSYNTSFFQMYDWGLSMPPGETFRIELTTDRNSSRLLLRTTKEDPKNCMKANLILQDAQINMPTTMNAYSVLIEYKNSETCDWTKHLFSLEVEKREPYEGQCVNEPTSGDLRTQDYSFLPLRCGSVAFCNYVATADKQESFFEMIIGMGDDSTVEEYYHLHLDYPEVLRPSCAGVVVSSSKQGVISLKEMASCNRQKPCLIGDADPITTLPFEYKTVGSYMTRIRLNIDKESNTEAHKDISFRFNLVTYHNISDKFQSTDYSCKDKHAGWIRYGKHCYQFFPKFGDTTVWFPKSEFREAGYLEGLTWNRAIEHCENEGGKLVSIGSRDELDFLKLHLGTTWREQAFVEGKYTIFIGVQDKKSFYQWTDHIPVTFADWYNPKESKFHINSRLTVVDETFDVAENDKSLIASDMQQPFSHPSTRCTVMFLITPHLSTNWIKIPCEYPFNRKGWICKANATKSNPDQIAYPKNPVVDSYIRKDDSGRNELFLANKGCEYGWLPFKDKCYRLKNITAIETVRALKDAHLDTCSKFELSFQQFRSDCAGLLQGLYRAAETVCESIGGTVATVNKEDLRHFLRYIGIFRHESGDAIWIHSDQIKNDADGYVCMALHLIPNIQRWSHNDVISVKDWVMLDMCTAQHDFAVDYGKIAKRLNFVMCSTDHSEINRPVHECNETQFKCDDNMCILRHHVCDGVQDCKDASDELNCTCGENTPDGFFACESDSSKCFSYSKYCDYYPDCTDLSDEKNCHWLNCTSDEFQCNNGHCIPLDQRCDHVKHCYDSSDEDPIMCAQERECQEPVHFQCFSGECIPFIQKRDDVPDCDGFTAEDEIDPEESDDNSNVTSIHICGEEEALCVNSLERCFTLKDACLYDEDKYNNLKTCRTGAHLKYCDDFQCPGWGYYKCPYSYCIPFRMLCDGHKHCPSGEDEEENMCEGLVCPGMFKCKEENFCLEKKFICDGIMHCNITGDDERFCNTTQCPEQCNCTGHTMNCAFANMTSIPESTSELRGLHFSGNYLDLHETTFEKYGLLGYLDLSDNNISQVIDYTFKHLTNLRELNLQFNMIKTVTQWTFYGLRVLVKLNLLGNPISRIGARGFHSCKLLPELNLTEVGLQEVEDNAFVGLEKLRKLDLGSNNLTVVKKETFTGLKSLDDFTLNLKSNQLANVQPNAFEELPVNTSLSTDNFKYCCFAKGIRDCLPKGDEFSSCEDLMENIALRVAIWVLGGIALLGNALVILWRFKSERGQVVSLLIQALGLSDMLMGVYLFIIASADESFRGQYVLHADEWKNSPLCKIAGFLNMLSSEMSVYMLVVITYERFVVVCFPFKLEYRMTAKSAKIVIAAGFFGCVLLSMFPILGIPYFGTKDYIKTGVCMLFNFTYGKVPGWEYNAAIYLCLNLIAFVFIFFGYMAIYRSVRNARKDAGKSFEEEATLVRRITFVLASDFICWMPIIITGILANLEYSISPQVSAWMVVFVMPLNSAINPILYTFSSIKRKPSARKKAKAIAIEQAQLRQQKAGKA